MQDDLGTAVYVQWVLRGEDDEITNGRKYRNTFIF